MRLAGNPRVEPLYKTDNLVIPCVKGSANELCRLIESVGQIDDKRNYIVTIEPEKRRRTLTANAYYWQLVKKIAKEYAAGVGRI